MISIRSVLSSQQKISTWVHPTNQISLRLPNPNRIFLCPRCSFFIFYVLWCFFCLPSLSWLVPKVVRLLLCIVHSWFSLRFSLTFILCAVFILTPILSVQYKNTERKIKSGYNIFYYTRNRSDDTNNTHWSEIIIVWWKLDHYCSIDKLMYKSKQTERENVTMTIID